MTHKLGRKIDQVEVKQFGVKVDVFLQTKTGQFSAEYANQTYGDPSLDALKKNVREAIIAGSSMTWVPVISLGLATPGGYNYGRSTVKTEFVIERYYVAQKLDGEFARVDWKVDAGLRLNAMRDEHNYTGDLTTVQYNNKTDYRQETDYNVLLPYTDEMWDSVQQIAAVIKSLHKLIALGLTPETGSMFPAVAAKLYDVMGTVEREFDVKAEAVSAEDADED